MKKLLLLTALLSLSAAAQDRLVDWVNPFVGTDGFGKVYPGAQVAIGGSQVSPDTDADE